MRDSQELVAGRWHVKFRQWTWEYVFHENRIVAWTDIINKETGTGRWTPTGKLINIAWNQSTTKESWYCPINPRGQKGWYASSYGTGEFTATRIETILPGASSFDFSVSGVPAVLQRDAPVCWAAGATMMIAWRNGAGGMTISQAMDKMGNPYIGMFQKRQAMNNRNFLRLFPDGEGIDVRQHFALAGGFKAEPLRSYTPRQLHDLMARSRSPLLVETHWDDEWTHMNVVWRISGQGSPSNTLIEYMDPNEGPLMKNFEEFMQLMEAAANQTTIQVWHF